MLQPTKKSPDQIRHAGKKNVSGSQENLEFVYHKILHHFQQALEIPQVDLAGLHPYWSVPDECCLHWKIAADSP